MSADIAFELEETTNPKILAVDEILREA